MASTPGCVPSRALGKAMAADNVAVARVKTQSSRQIMVDALAAENGLPGV
jgi:hypothetical protein